MRCGAILVVVVASSLGCGGSTSGAGPAASEQDAGLADTGTSSCTPGLACLSTNPCRLAATGCPSGACVEMRDAPDDTPCDAGNVCSGGSCVPPTCVAGTSCQPAEPCRTGMTVCSSPAKLGTCQAGAAKPDATDCGTGMICSAGACVVKCVEGLRCDPGDPCMVGETSCASATSAPTCVAVGQQLQAHSCGPDRICDIYGECVDFACVQGASCAVAIEPDTVVFATSPGTVDFCKIGAMQCPALDGSCVPVGNTPDGTVCHLGGSCYHGSCISPCYQFCETGNPCTIGCQWPDSETGALGDCQLHENVPDGNSCGAGLVCSGGDCVTPGALSGSAR